MYRLVYNEETKELIMDSSASGVHTDTIHTVEEFETKTEMEVRIIELKLIRMEAMQ